MFELMYPLPTPSLNVWLRLHHRERTRIKKQMAMVAICAARLHGPHAATRAHVTITRHGYGTLDQDNLIGGCKPLIDALTTAGFIVDDSPRWLQADYHQVKVPRGRGRTDVRVEYVAETLEPTQGAEQNDSAPDVCPTCGTRYRSAAQRKRAESRSRDAAKDLD